MRSKLTERRKEDIAEADDFDVEVAISELNQSVAYLSKMVLQLQRSFNDKPKKIHQHPKKETIH